jgi:hypothetical protein
MTMEFCRFRDFAVPLLGLSPRHPSIHGMRTTGLVDSSFRAPHLPETLSAIAIGPADCIAAVHMMPLFAFTMMPPTQDSVRDIQAFVFEKC